MNVGMIGPRDNWAQTSEVLWQGKIERRDDWAQTSEIIWQGIIERRDDWSQRQLRSDFTGALAGDN